MKEKVGNGTDENGNDDWSSVIYSYLSWSSSPSPGKKEKDSPSPEKEDVFLNVKKHATKDLSENPSEEKNPSEEETGQALITAAEQITGFSGIQGEVSSADGILYITPVENKIDLEAVDLAEFDDVEIEYDG